MDPISPPPLARRQLAPLVHRITAWIARYGAVAPEDPRARRFRTFGQGSLLAFPQGHSFGEEWIEIGAWTLIGPHVTLSAGLPGEGWEPSRAAVVRIGERCNIGRYSSIAARREVVIEDDVTTGPNVYVTDHNHRYADTSVPVWRQWFDEAPVRIGAGTWLGANVVVLPGSDIGRNVTVGASAVVRGTVPDFAVVAGNPAQVLRRHLGPQGWDPPLAPGEPPPPAWTAQ